VQKIVVDYEYQDRSRIANQRGNDNPNNGVFMDLNDRQVPQGPVKVNHAQNKNRYTSKDRGKRKVEASFHKAAYNN
jgi:hypothetical protein